MPETLNMGIPTMPTNPNDPAAIYSNGVQQIENSLAQPLTLDCSAGGTIALSQAQSRNYGTYILTGTPAAAFELKFYSTMTFKAPFMVVNSSGQDVTVSCGTENDTVDVLDGEVIAMRMISANSIHREAPDAAPGGPGGTPGLEWIATLTPSGNNASFTSIAGTYAHLLIIGAGRSDTNAAQTDSVRAQFNNDTGANYNRIYTHNYGGTAAANRQTGESDVRIGDVPTDNGSGIADWQGDFQLLIPNYALGRKKTCQFKASAWAGNTVNDFFAVDGVGGWNSTAVINRVDLKLGSGDNWSGASISLYGYKV